MASTFPTVTQQEHDAEVAARIAGDEALDAAKQDLDPQLTALATLSSEADSLPYFSGPAEASVTAFTAFARSLVAATDAAGARAVLGVSPVAHSHGKGEIPGAVAYEDEANTFTANQVIQGNLDVTGSVNFNALALGDDGDGRVAMGDESNPVVLFGYNQDPYYQLADTEKKSLATVIEAHYEPTPGAEWMEWYVQYLGTDNDAGSTLRPFMAVIDKVGEEIYETLVTGGANHGGLKLNVADGTGTDSEKRIGRTVVGIPGLNQVNCGAEADDKFIFNVSGVNDAGTVAALRLVDGNSSQYFEISTRATALAMQLNIAFNGGSNFVTISNTGTVTLSGLLNGLGVVQSADNVKARVGASGEVQLGTIGSSGESGVKLAAGASNPPVIIASSGAPNGAVTANPGSLFLRRDGGASTTLYVKESGTGNTGWRAV